MSDEQDIDYRSKYVSVRQKLREARAALAERDKQVDELTGVSEDLLKERDDYKTKIEAAPGDLQKRIAELEGTIRERTHRDKFNSLAKELGARDNAADALWKLSDYKVEGDKPDDAKIKAAIESTFASHDFLKRPAETTETAPNANAGKTAETGSIINLAARTAAGTSAPGRPQIQTEARTGAQGIVDIVRARAEKAGLSMNGKIA